MRLTLLGAAALALAGCGGLITGERIASNPKADAMRLCGSLVDITTPGVSIPAISSLVGNALNPTATAMLGRDPALVMRKCADMYDSLAAKSHGGPR